jgi:hypothetical protein
MERNLKTVKNEKCTLNDLEMARNTKNCGKWDSNTVGPGIWREILRNVENEKCTL